MTRVSEPLVSVYTTVYNSIKSVEKSIESMAKQLEGMSYEIVVVDNYSTDGTFEKIIELSTRYPIRVYRYRCSRGLGRRIAAKLSHGKYLIYGDLDCIYTSSLRKIIEIHLNSVYRDSKCLDILICPKAILEKEGFLDLNRTEDVELFTRLGEKGLVYTLPKIKRISVPLRYEMRTRSLSSFLHKLIPTLISEHRYAKNLLEYLKRELRNKRDYVIGGGATPSKFVREEWFIWRIWRRNPIVTVLLRIFLFIVLYYVVCWLMNLKPKAYDEHLTNHLYRDFMSLKHIALPQELGLSCKDIEIPRVKELVSYLQYALRFKAVGEFKRLWRLLAICNVLRLN